MAARGLLLDDAVPLLTLTGPGGVGKTRLALAMARDVAERFAGGVAWVDLAPLTDPGLVPPAIARALDVMPTADVPIEDELARYLHMRQTLLLLDNCEHLVAPIGELVAMLLAQCPALQVLATSRIPLSVHGEQRLPVEPLPLPPADTACDLEAVSQSEAVRLFMVCARRARPSLELDDANAATIAAICRRLDGLPLAIELAAARAAVLPPAALLARLDSRLCLLTAGPRDAPARQRTLHDTIAWSYALLDPEARRVFRALSVFVDGFTLEGVEGVVGGEGNLDLLASLVDHSLVQRSANETEPRFSMLETIREFARDQLEQDVAEATAIRDAHAAYFAHLALAERISLSAGVPKAVRRLRNDEGNLRAALAHLLAMGDVDTALRVGGGSLSEYWLVASGQISEGRAWLERVLRDGGQASPEARAWGLYGVAMLAVHQMDLSAARTALAESLALAKAAHHPKLAALASFILCLIEEAEGRFEAADTLAMGVVETARRVSDPVLLGWSLMALGNVRWQRGDAEGAAALVEDARRRFHEFGGAWGEADALTILAAMARAAGDLPRAARLHADALVIRRDAGETVGIANDVIGLAEIAHRSGLHDGAVHLLAAEDASRADTRYEGFGTAPTIRQPVRHAALDHLGEARFARAWTEGRALSTEQTIAEALAIAESILALHQRQPGSDRPSSDAAALPFGADLSPRELEVLQLLCQHLTDPEIAERLFLSPRTVESHVSRLLGKLGAENRRDAAAIAARYTLV